MQNAYYWLQEGREGGQNSQKPAYVIHGCSPENAIIIQKEFVLQNWRQGQLFSFCRTGGGQHTFLWFASKVFPRSFSVALFAKENWAKNAIITQKGFVLQTWGQGHLFSFCRTGVQLAFFEIWVQSFPRSFSVALVTKENWAENAIIIQKGFVLQNWGQGHLFSFCRTGGQHAFLRFASKVFSRSFSFPLVAREYWIFNAGQCFAFLWYH